MYSAFIQVENTIRWRYARDEHGNVKYDELGNQQKESNAQVVRWSDGRCLLFIIATFHFTYVFISLAIYHGHCRWQR